VAVKKPIRYIDYVCNPSNIRIEADYPSSSVYLYITMKVDNKPAFYGQYKFEYTTDREDFDDKVKIFCNAMLLFNENEVYNYVEADNLMAALNIYRNLKEVRNRTGSLIWKRP